MLRRYNLLSAVKKGYRYIGNQFQPNIHSNVFLVKVDSMCCCYLWWKSVWTNQSDRLQPANLTKTWLAARKRAGSMEVLWAAGVELNIRRAFTSFSSSLSSINMLAVEQMEAVTCRCTCEQAVIVVRWRRRTDIVSALAREAKTKQGQWWLGPNGKTQ